jgi:hypothetical protein
MAQIREIAEARVMPTRAAPSTCRGFGVVRTGANRSAQKRMLLASLTHRLSPLQDALL